MPAGLRCFQVDQCGVGLFVFARCAGPGNVDTVSDFARGADRIALDHNVFTAFSTTHAAGQLWFDADGNGAGEPVLFETWATSRPSPRPTSW
jgi:hypothetical protein